VRQVSFTLLIEIIPRSGFPAENDFYTNSQQKM
jgi:hypothetical protein